MRGTWCVAWRVRRIEGGDCRFNAKSASSPDLMGASSYQKQSDLDACHGQRQQTEEVERSRAEGEGVGVGCRPYALSDQCSSAPSLGCKRKNE
jgi:hypothetical protein